MSPVIRPYRASDRAAVDDVCVRTGDAGRDATGLFTPDTLLPDIFAGPYLALEPDLAFVVDDGTRAVGYVLGTADTARWAAAHRRTYLPTVADRYPRADPPVTPRDHLVDLLHHPERNVHPGLAAHPAHLHIDLLPTVQGHGWGRRLVRTFLGALREREVAAFHLGMTPSNLGARAFYDRLGLTELPVDVPGVVYLGGPTDLAV